MKRELAASSEVHNLNAKNSVEVPVLCGDAPFQFFPKHVDLARCRGIGCIQGTDENLKNQYRGPAGLFTRESHGYQL